MSRYPVPQKTIRSEYQVSNSRFITTIGPAATVDEAKAFIQSIRDEMPDATHHVYAYQIGYGSSVTEGMSDDGEPTGTSGPPTLTVVRGENIGDVVLVTTRYFGGTKLGTGGLVYAYTNAAKRAFAQLPIEEKVTRRTVGVTLPYTLYDRFTHLLEDFEALVEDEQFAADVTVYLRLPQEHLDAFTATLQELSSGQVTPILLDD